ncbi:MAG TPA: DUF493 domain-containing protein [Flavobacteriales bacterium]|nr:DUF493 domain-containing protein [Flavobacteriales bacterium]
MKKPEIAYPCDWSFRIICEDEQCVRQAVKLCLGERDYTLHHANTSRSGRYVSLNLTTQVKDEDDRNHIFTHLQQVPSVSMIL